MRLMVSGATTSVEALLQDPDVSPHLGAMVTPNTSNSITRICGWNIPWCLDNACFDAARFSEQRYLALLERAAKAPRRPAFVTVPDKVGDHDETLRLFWAWLPRLLPYRLPLAFVAQDGLDYYMDDLPWDWIEAVFIGGSDDFKDDRTIHIAERCREQGKWCHVGRVNGKRRLRLALHNGCDSVDGSSLSMFAMTWLPKFARALRDLLAEGQAIDALCERLEGEVQLADALRLAGEILEAAAPGPSGHARAG